jgi:hypothetical protein
MPPILFCRQCNTGYAAIGLIPALCPACRQRAHWTTALFSLTEQDRIFLRVNRIKPDERIEEDGA